MIGVPEQKAAPFSGAKQIRYSRKTTTLDIFKENGRTARLENPEMDGGHFKMGINLMADPYKVLVLF